MTDQPRAPKGQPTGGQFSAAARDEPSIELAAGTYRPVDPAVAHQLDARTLLGLLDRPDQRHLHDIRLELARRISAGPRRGQRYATWQDAWNDLAQVDSRGHGQIRLTNVPCPGCNGRGFDARHVARNLARTGNPAVCGQCTGRRRTNITLPARRAEPSPEKLKIDPVTRRY